MGTNSEMVQIRGWKQMYNDYIYEGFKNGQDAETIKRNLIEAFRKEIFGQITFRCRVEDVNDLPHTRKNDEIVTNIFKESLKKWRALVKECRQHLTTMNLLNENDLTLWDEEEQEDDDGGYEIGEAEDPEKTDGEAEEDEEPEEIDEMTAEWPELSESSITDVTERIETDGYSAESSGPARSV